MAAYSSTSTNSPNHVLVSYDESVDLTTQLMEQSDNAISSYTGPNDFVFIVGNTGSGKSTQKIFLTKPEDLVCYDAGDRFLIMDRDPQKQNISRGSTIVSKTLFPQIAFNENTRTAFCDFPGFGDTRSEVIQIVNSFSIKKVADRASKVKILLVINHSSVKSGESRNDFIALLENLTCMIKNPSKYARSIALVATKVDSRKTSEQIIDGIGKFLSNVRADLGKINLDEAKRAAAKIIIDALITQQDQKYTKISIFSEPTQENPLNAIPSAMTERGQILKMLSAPNLEFTDSSPNDFGLNISKSAEMLLMKISDKMNGNISETMARIGSVFKKVLTDRVNGSSLEDIGTLFNQQQTLKVCIEELTPDIRRQIFFAFLQNLTNSLNFGEALDQELETLELRQRKLIVIEGFLGGDSPANILEWISPIQSAADIFKDAILKKAGKYMDEIGNKMSQDCANVDKRFQSKLLQLQANPSKSTALLRTYTDTFGKLNEELQRTKSVNDFIRKVQSTIGSLDGEVDSSGLQILKEDVNFGDQPFYKLPWMKPFENLEGKLREASRIHAIKCENKEEMKKQEKKIKEQEDRLKQSEQDFNAKLKEQKDKSESAIQEQNQKLEKMQKRHEKDMQRQKEDWERRVREREEELAKQREEMQKQNKTKDEAKSEKPKRESIDLDIRIPTSIFDILLPPGPIFRPGGGGCFDPHVYNPSVFPNISKPKDRPTMCEPRDFPTICEPISPTIFEPVDFSTITKPAISIVSSVLPTISKQADSISRILPTISKPNIGGWLPKF